MANGKVKWFNSQKLWLREPEEGSQDVFVHISAVKAAGMDSLSDGQAISLE